MLALLPGDLLADAELHLVEGAAGKDRLKLLPLPVGDRQDVGAAVVHPQLLVVHEGGEVALGDVHPHHPKDGAVGGDERDGIGDDLPVLVGEGEGRAPVAEVAALAVGAGPGGVQGGEEELLVGPPLLPGEEEVGPPEAVQGDPHPPGGGGHPPLHEDVGDAGGVVDRVQIPQVEARLGLAALVSLHPHAVQDDEGPGDPVFAQHVDQTVGEAVEDLGVEGGVGDDVVQGGAPIL